MTYFNDLVNSSGNIDFKWVMKKLKVVFGTEEETVFRYVGREVNQAEGAIKINQDHYWETIQLQKFGGTRISIRWYQRWFRKFLGLELCFPDLNHVKDWCVEVYRDAVFKNLQVKVSSGSGCAVFVKNKRTSAAC